MSPEVGVLDESALDDLVRDDPDEALSLLADLAGATDQRLRRLAGDLAARIAVDVARLGATSRRAVGRPVRASAAVAEGELDLDASLEAIHSSRTGGHPVAPAQLVVSSWQRPDTAVCLLVDRSGSMLGERLATAAVAAAAVVLRSTSSSVVAFADRPIVLSSPSDPRPAASVVNDLLTLRGFGVTDVAAALRAAQELLSRTTATRRLTLLLSDARATAGADPTEWAAAVDELVVIPPADDTADADALATATSARCIHLGGPSTVVDALTEAITPS